MADPPCDRPAGRVANAGRGAGGSPTNGDGADAAVEPLVVSTEADRRLDLAIAQLGGKGAFASEVQAAVLDGRADLAVHSAKDLLGDARGARCRRCSSGTTPVTLVGVLDELLPGARVGTGSPRRRAQLAWRRPDLTFAEVRGNVGTRLGKLDAGLVDVLVLALSALERLSRPAAEVLSPSVMLPQVAQGTLCVECRRTTRRPGRSWDASSSMRPPDARSTPSGVSCGAGRRLLPAGGGAGSHGGPRR